MFTHTDLTWYDEAIASQVSKQSTSVLICCINWLYLWWEDRSQDIFFYRIKISVDFRLNFCWIKKTTTIQQWLLKTPSQQSNMPMMSVEEGISSVTTNQTGRCTLSCAFAWGLPLQGWSERCRWCFCRAARAVRGRVTAGEAKMLEICVVRRCVWAELDKSLSAL